MPLKSNRRIKSNHQTKVDSPYICSGRPARPSTLRRYLQPANLVTAGDLAEQAKRRDDVRPGSCQVLRECARILIKQIVVLQTACSGHRFPPSAWIATALCMRQDISISHNIMNYRCKQIERSRDIITQRSICPTYVPGGRRVLEPCAGMSNQR